MFIRLTLLLVAFFAASTSLAADIERTGPVRLVCLNPDGLIEQVKNLTRQQIVGITHAARAGEVKWPCDDVQLPVGTRWPGHARWVKTEDDWWVLALTVVYPNNFTVVVVDPVQARKGKKPPEFRVLRLPQCPPGLVCQ